MKNFKKLMSLLLVVVMVFAMSANAFAATSDPNFTKTSDTAWSTVATAGSAVIVKAGPANAYYSFTGFDTSDEAKAVSVSYNCGEDLVQSISVDSALVASTNTYAAAVSVTPKSNVTGPISIRVSKSSAASAPYVDLTIYVEKASGYVDDVTVDVEVVDLHDDTYMYEYGSSMTVKAAGKETANPYNASAGCAQTYPTAAGALYSLMRAGNISFTQSEGYVGTISDNHNNSLEGYTNEDWTIYYGWNYCVLRDDPTTAAVDYEIVAESSVVSASVLPVQEGDRVFWAFGTTDECAGYFNGLVGTPA